MKYFLSIICIVLFIANTAKANETLPIAIAVGPDRTTVMLYDSPCEPQFTTMLEETSPIKSFLHEGFILISTSSKQFYCGSPSPSLPSRCSTLMKACWILMDSLVVIKTENNQVIFIPKDNFVAPDES